MVRDENNTWGGWGGQVIILIFAVAQKQITTLCKMRKAKSWPPQWVSKFHEIVGNNEYYNEQGTQDNTDLIADQPTNFSSVVCWGNCFCLTRQSVRLNLRGTVFTSLPLLHFHTVHWLDMARLKGHWLVLTTEFPRNVILERWRPFMCVLSSPVSEKSFTTNYKINILMVQWSLFCMLDWRHIKAVKRNSIRGLKTWDEKFPIKFM
jgi:hypothetical protein